MVVNETFVVDESVVILVCLADHLVELLLGHFLAEALHDVAQLLHREVPVVVLVEYPGN